MPGVGRLSYERRAVIWRPGAGADRAAEAAFGPWSTATSKESTSATTHASKPGLWIWWAMCETYLVAGSKWSPKDRSAPCRDSCPGFTPDHLGPTFPMWTYAGVHLRASTNTLGCATR